MPNTEKVGLWWAYKSPVCVCVYVQPWTCTEDGVCSNDLHVHVLLLTPFRLIQGYIYVQQLPSTLIFFITINNGLTKHVNQDWQKGDEPTKVISTTANFTVLHLNMHHIQPWECDGMTSLKSTIIPLKQLCSRILQAFTWLKFPIPVCSFLAIKMTNGY